MSDFGIAVSPSAITIPAAGQPATYNVQITPHPVFGTSVSLTVSGLPTGTSFQFSTPSVSLTGTSPATSTLVISTTARPITTPAASLASAKQFYAIWLALPGLAVLGLGAGDRRRRRIAGMLLMCLLSFILLLQPACSHTTTQPPVSGTPAGSYPLTVTGTAGSDTKSAGVTLTVP
jgi:hypothetical protein